MLAREALLISPDNNEVSTMSDFDRNYASPFGRAVGRTDLGVRRLAASDCRRSGRSWRPASTSVESGARTSSPVARTISLPLAVISRMWKSLSHGRPECLYSAWRATALRPSPAFIWTISIRGSGSRSLCRQCSSATPTSDQSRSLITIDCSRDGPTPIPEIRAPQSSSIRLT